MTAPDTSCPLDAAALDRLDDAMDVREPLASDTLDALIAQARIALTLRDELAECRALLATAGADAVKKDRRECSHYCGWCGYSQAGSEGMAEHAQECEKNPLRAKLADERKHADELAGGLTNAYIECRIYDGTPEFDSLAQQIHANMAEHAARRAKEAASE